MHPLEMRFEFNNKLLNLKENQRAEVDVDNMPFGLFCKLMLNNA